MYAVCCERVVEADAEVGNKSAFDMDFVFHSFIPNIGEYYSYKIDIVPKTEYTVWESEVYSLCI